MEFSKEQQAYIDTLISRKYSEAYAKSEAKYQSVLAEAAEVRLAPLQAKLAEAYDRLRKMAIQSAAAQAGAVDASQVAYLLDGSVRVDAYGVFYAVDDNGERRYDRDGAPLHLQDLAAEFLRYNTHFLKPPAVDSQNDSWPGF